MSKRKQAFYKADAAHLPQALLQTSATQDNHKTVPQLKSQSPNQRFYINHLRSDIPFVVAHGPAGTGKTYPAVIYAIREYMAGNIKKIIITRPLVNVEEEEVGTLPGGIIEKVSPWMLPILDILKEYWTPFEVQKMLENEAIEIAPLAFMRGRTFKNALVIADEAQNMTPAQMKMLLTRIGENSRIIITGDIEQTDRRVGQNGLEDLIKRLGRDDNQNFGVTKFDQSDVVRHPAIDGVLTLYA